MIPFANNPLDQLLKWIKSQKENDIAYKQARKDIARFCTNATPSLDEIITFLERKDMDPAVPEPVLSSLPYWKQFRKNIDMVLKGHEHYADLELFEQFPAHLRVLQENLGEWLTRHPTLPQSYTTRLQSILAVLESEVVVGYLKEPVLAVQTLERSDAFKSKIVEVLKDCDNGACRSLGDWGKFNPEGNLSLFASMREGVTGGNPDIFAGLLENAYKAHVDASGKSVEIPQRLEYPIKYYQLVKQLKGDAVNLADQLRLCGIAIANDNVAPAQTYERTKEALEKLRADGSFGLDLRLAGPEVEKARVFLLAHTGDKKQQKAVELFFGSFGNVLENWLEEQRTRALQFDDCRLTSREGQLPPKPDPSPGQGSSKASANAKTSPKATTRPNASDENPASPSLIVPGTADTLSQALGVSANGRSVQEILKNGERDRAASLKRQKHVSRRDSLDILPRIGEDTSKKGR